MKTNEEKSRVIAGKAGICWHKKIISANSSVHNFYCPCGYTCVSPADGWDEHIEKHLKENNPDFFTPEGQEILEEKLWAIGSSDIGTKFTIWAEKTERFNDEIDNEHIWTDTINSVELAELFYEFIESEGKDD